MGKYIIVIALISRFKIWPGYKRYKSGEKNIGFFEIMEGFSISAIFIIGCFIELH